MKFPKINITDNRQVYTRLRYGKPKVVHLPPKVEPEFRKAVKPSLAEKLYHKLFGK